MTNVLLIGNGAREHAIARALHKSGVILWSLMEYVNPGIESLSERAFQGKLNEIDTISNLEEIDYAVVGPEAPLGKGVVDELEQRGIPAVGPCKGPANLEISKVFARQLLQRVSPEANPRFEVVNRAKDINTAIDEIGLEDLVIKPDGLTGGKGVRLFEEHVHSRDEAIDYAERMIQRDGCVILEEKLAGREFTVQAFVDGSGRIEPMPLVRDFKRAFDGDTGPNTGSMGSYSRQSHDLEYLSNSEADTAVDIMRKTVKAVEKETGESYKGILYGQFMKTQDQVKVIEFNVRFGDPEAMNVLSILETPMNEVCQGIINGSLKKPQFKNLATVCVYIVPEGYPGDSVLVDEPLFVRNGIENELYYASVYRRKRSIYTTGSRSIAILAKGPSVREARNAAYRDVDKIDGRVRYRKDIAEEF
ncbi:MAG: phosphoribosylamine--glycine ligase [Candidatus Thorarchaeota archaeon]